MAKRAFTFPGQGSQAVGMGQRLSEAFPTAKQVFQEVDDALGQDLSKIMFEGPADVLQLTENAQPALMAVSLAVIRVLAEKGVNITEHASFIAGHSLGEYSALCAAGTFSIGDTAILLKTRGRAMQQAVPVGEGAMAALLGLEIADVHDVAARARQGEVCDVANDNAPGQVVVSGTIAAVERAIELAKAKGAKRAMLLPVSAPFHCALMAPAAEKMEEALALVKMQNPCVPLICNVLAAPISEASEIRKRLVEQVTGMVRWTESVNWLATEGGVTELLELGTGKVLTGLAKRINADLAGKAINTAEDIDAFVAEILG